MLCGKAGAAWFGEGDAAFPRVADAVTPSALLQQRGRLGAVAGHSLRHEDRLCAGGAGGAGADTCRQRQLWRGWEGEGACTPAHGHFRLMCCIYCSCAAAHAKQDGTRARECAALTSFNLRLSPDPACLLLSFCALQTLCACVPPGVAACTAWCCRIFSLVLPNIPPVLNCLLCSMRRSDKLNSPGLDYMLARPLSPGQAGAGGRATSPARGTHPGVAAQPRPGTAQHGPRGVNAANGASRPTSALAAGLATRLMGGGGGRAGGL
eukprot:359602-Chlamydomonas_euryale.AAC.1